MGLISLVLPSIGEKVTSSDPRIVTAFSTLQTVINGNLNSENIAASFKEALPIASGQVYGTPVLRSTGTEYEPSASRAVQVALALNISSGGEVHVLCGGVQIGSVGGTASSTSATVPFVCPPGKKWEVTKVAGTITVESSYLPL